MAVQPEGWCSLPTVALIGRFDAGCAQVFDAAVGRHVVDSTRGRLALRSGTLQVPDRRLELLRAVMGSQRTVPVELTLWDYPNNALQSGGPTEAEWVGHLRTADALLGVTAPATTGGLEAEAERAVAELRTELALHDLAMLEAAIPRAQERVERGPRLERRAAEIHLQALQSVLAVLERGRPLATGALSEIERGELQGFGLLSLKSLAVALNVPDDAVREARAWLRTRDEATWAVVAGATEAELHELDPTDAAAFRTDLGFAADAAARLSRAILAAAGLLTFYAGNERATSAWLIQRGATAVQAAGAIHSDLAAGFIRADVASADDLLEAGGLAALRDAGALRREGRDYVLADGDFLLVHFSR